MSNIESQLDCIFDDIKKGLINNETAIDSLQQFERLLMANHHQADRNQGDYNQNVVETSLYIDGYERVEVLTRSDDPSSDTDTNGLKSVTILCEPSEGLRSELAHHSVRSENDKAEIVVLSSTVLCPAERFYDHARQLFEHCKNWVATASRSSPITLNLCLFPREENDHDAGGLSLVRGLTALCKTVCLENPCVNLLTVEFSGEKTLPEIQQAIAQASGSTSLESRTLRFSRSGWKRRFWTPLTRDVSTVAMPWKNQGVYVITGALGGLGRLFAVEIAKRTSSATLYLVGRRELNSVSARRWKKLETELRGHGADVHYRALDVSDSVAVDGLFNTIEQENNTLNGILHCAGALDDKFIQQKSAQEFEHTLAPKVHGAIALDRASRHFELDVFVLFSSVSGVFGNIGQSDYATANAFMDDFARRRNAQVGQSQRHGTTLSINWPLWRSGGMSLQPAAVKLLQEQFGIHPLPKKEGLDAFYRALMSGRSQVVVLHGATDKVRKILLPDVKLTEKVAESRSATFASESEPIVSIRKSLAKILGVAVEHIDEYSPMSAFGSDAVSLVSLRRALVQHYGVYADTLTMNDSQSLYDVAQQLTQLQKVRSEVVDHHDIHDTPIPASAAAPSKEPQVEHSEPAGHGSRYAGESPDEITMDHLREKSVAYFIKMFSSTLKMQEDMISAEQHLEVYGVDSIMVMEMTNNLEKEFGPLPKTLFFEYQTLAELSDYFVENYKETLTRLLGVSSGESHSKQLDVDDSRVASTFSRSSRLIPEPVKQIEEAPSSVENRDSVENKDIAIVGLSGRYPKSRSVNQFWETLRNGVDCISEIPEDRWDHSQFFNPKKGQPGKSYSKWGGFIDGVDEFDPLFFNILPNDAKLMDPQERLFLQSVYETIEDAGYTRHNLAARQDETTDSNVGVFVGVMYQQYQLYGGVDSSGELSSAVSCNTANIANRVSYFCNFDGPSMAIDTMCSSSLTALHLACQSLHNRECAVAIAGGVNVSIHPSKYTMLSQGQFVSSKGRCESFGEGGEGYVPGEGVGSVLLKPLQSAIEDGDHIYGIVKGSSINHGGKASGYTVPNPVSQARVIRNAYRRANIDPQDVSYIEAHGTGTSLGDPIEMSGLERVFKDRSEPCAIGSVKSNIGHCESAAGIAGLTKVLLQIKHKKIVPSLHSSTLNPNIDFERSAFSVQQELKTWRRPTRRMDGVQQKLPRIAGISSFGAGGANAHVIIEEFIDQRESSQRSNDESLVILSANSERSLRKKMKELKSYLETHLHRTPVEDIAYTLQVGREAMQYRIAMVVHSSVELIEKLEAGLANKKSIEGYYSGNRNSHRDVLSYLEDDDIKLAISSWARKKKYSRLLSLWVKGLDVDWTEMHSAGQFKRVSLPGHIFEVDRYWVDHAPMQRVGYQVSQSSVAPRALTISTDWKTQPATRDADDFFYKISWQPMSLPSSQSPRGIAAQRRSVIVLHTAESAQLLNGMMPHLESDDVALIEIADSVEQVDRHSWRVTPENIEQHIVHHFSGLPITDVLFLDVNGSAAEESDAPEIIVDTGTSLFSAFKALNALKVTGLELSIKIVTQDVHKVFDSPNAGKPCGASSLGLVQTMCNEYAKVSACCIDIDSVSSQVDTQDRWNRLAELIELEPVSKECSVVAVRDMQRFMRTFSALPVSSSAEQDKETSTYRQLGVYVIVGGASGIGFELAKHLAKNYSARIVIAGRSPYDQAKQAMENQLEALGGKAAYVSADICTAKGAAKLMEEANAKFGQINGVVHSAVVLNDVMLGSMDTRQYEMVTAPKVIGCQNLAVATANEPLDFMVFFSSVAGFAGQPGQANYASASTFEDSFAVYLDGQRDYPVKVVDWGYWGSVGMAANEFQQRKFAAQGILPIGNEEGISGLEKILVGEHAQVIAFKAKDSVLKTFGIERSIESDGEGEIQPKALDVPEKKVATTAQSSVSVRSQLLAEFSSLSGIAPETIDTQADWTELGVDSIKMMEMLAAIESRWSIRVYPNELLEYSNLDSFSAYLTDEIGDNNESNDDSVLSEDEVANIIPTSSSNRDVDDVDEKGDVRSLLVKGFSKQSGIPVERVDLHAPWTELGVDSIRMMEMLADIEHQFGLRVYPNELQDLETLDELAGYLMSELNDCEPQSEQQTSTRNEQERIAERGVPPLPLPQRRDSIVQNGPMARPLIYILSTPRAGSTLLRVMMMGSPEIFSPPELHLLPFDTLGQRSRYFAENNRQFLGEGFIESISQLKNLDAASATDYVEALTHRDTSVSSAYKELQDLANGRYVVDKSPTYANDLHTLQRAEQVSEKPLYVFLVRHPLAVMDSFVRNRFHKLLGIDEDPWVYAQRLWLNYNRNLLQFLSTVPQQRQCLIRYEDLVSNPREVMNGFCEKFGVSFDDSMLSPYGEGRMTRGLHEHSMTIGDPNFKKHNDIDASLADAWKKAADKAECLMPETILIAKELGYEIYGACNYPLAPAQQDFLADFGADPEWLISQRIDHEHPVVRADYTAALQRIVDGQPALRMSFKTSQGRWLQQLHDNPTVIVDEIDLSSVDKEQHQDAMDSIEQRLRDRLRIDRAPLLTSATVKISATQHVTILVIHHLVSDGLTLQMINQEIAALFDSPTVALPHPASSGYASTQYFHYLEQTQRFLHYDVMSDDIDFWKSEIEGEYLEPSEYPKDRNTVDNIVGSERSCETVVSLADLGFSSPMAKAKVFDVISTALYRTVGAWAGETSPLIAHRLHRRTIGKDSSYFDAMGWFAGDVVLKLDLSQEKGEHISQFNRKFKSIPGGGLSYEMLSQAGIVPRAHDAAAVRLNYQPFRSFFKRANAEVQLIESADHDRHYLLDVIARVNDASLELMLRYSSGRFQERTMIRLLNTLVEHIQELGLDESWLSTLRNITQTRIGTNARVTRIENIETTVENIRKNSVVKMSDSSSSSP